MRNHEKEELIDFGKTTRSKKPRYALIPHCAIDDMAARFELGEIKHGEKAWNALAPNYIDGLTKEWVIAALEHIVHHSLTAIDKINGANLEEDDDAGAIMFGGAVLSAYNDLLRRRG